MEKFSRSRLLYNKVYLRPDKIVMFEIIAGFNSKECQSLLGFCFNKEFYTCKWKELALTNLPHGECVRISSL